MMKYCSNCGEQIDEKAVICVKCGVPVSESNINVPSYNTPSYTEVKTGNGAATASLVLGILGVIASVITLVISIGIASYYANSWERSLYSLYSNTYDSEKVAMAFLVTAVPGILSLIGFPLGLFCRKGGSKVAGIVLNTIALAICIIQVIIIMSI